MNEPLVSIVVPAYNCEKTVQQTLQAIFKQTYKNYEVIVVDDGSSDRTREIVCSMPSIKYIFQQNAGPAAARNRGAEESKGEIIFFTDSDCIPEENWIEKAISAFEETKVAAVAGSYGIANSESILARIIQKEITFRHQHLLPRYIKVFGSYNVGIRRKIFQEVGGFDPSYRNASGEDNDLSYKILKSGYKIRFEPLAIVKHYHATKLGRYLYEQYRHGYWRVKMYRDHPTMMSGDDYTFWKDVLEVPLSFGILLDIFLFKVSLLQVFGSVCLALLLFLESIYSFLITKPFLERISLFFVMSLRAFARMLGFSSGIFHLFLKK